MDQEQDTLTMPPFWLPNGDGNHHNRRHLLRRSYSLLLTSTSLLFLLLIITLVFGLIVVPTLHSFASNILRPHTVKNSWDSLNLVLVLFAIVCGFLSKTNTNETQNQEEETLMNPQTPPPYWYDYSNRSFNRLRSFNSHPDLRQYSSWINDDEPRRFYDDTNLILRHRKQRLDPEEEEEEGVVSVEKVVTVDSVEVAAVPELEPELEVLPETRRKGGRRNVKRTYQVETIEEPERDYEVGEITQSPPPQQQPEAEMLPSSTLPETRRKGVRRNVKRTYQAEPVEKPEREDVAGEITQLTPPPPSTLPGTRRKSVRRNVKRTYQAETIEKPERDDVVGEISEPPLPLQPESLPLPPSLSPSLPPVTRTKGVRRNVKLTHQVETIEKPGRDYVDGEISRQPQQLEPQILPPPQLTSQPPVTRTEGTRTEGVVRRNVKQTYQAAEVKISTPPPPPPPPPPISVEGKTMPGKKKRGSATKEFLISLRGKKKKQRQKSVENLESILNPEPSQPQPSPPPPHQPSVFHDLFSSKKSKKKKSYIVSVATQKPQLPNKREHSYNYNLKDNVSNTVTGIGIGIGNQSPLILGNESPLIPIPPPPPPPPFKLPAWKFRVKGDFVRVDSIGSSRSGSPDLDEVVESPTSQLEETSQCNSPYSEGPSSATATATATATAASLFCPSPDVDTKAHNFIESFRAGLRMARINSMKEKQVIGRSNLGPSRNSNQTLN